MQTPQWQSLKETPRMLDYTRSHSHDPRESLHPSPLVFTHLNVHNSFRYRSEECCLRFERNIFCNATSQLSEALSIVYFRLDVPNTPRPRLSIRPLSRRVVLVSAAALTAPVLVCSTAMRRRCPAWLCSCCLAVDIVFTMVITARDDNRHFTFRFFAPCLVGVLPFRASCSSSQSALGE